MRALKALLVGFALAGLTTLAFSRDISSMTGAGTKIPSAAGVNPICSSYVPAAFTTSAIYIDWTVQAGDGSWGMACLSNTTSVAANTLGNFVAGSGSVSAGSTGLTITTGGSFQFTNTTWVTSTSGTLYINASTTTIASGIGYFVNLSDGSNSNFQALLRSSALITGQQAVSGANHTAGSTFNATANTLFKFAYSYTSGAQITCGNGANNTTGTQAGSVTGLNSATFGLSATGGSGINGLITAFAFFAAARANTAACDTLTS